MPSQPHPTPNINTNIVRRLNCSQRRRDFGVVGAVIIE
jgi:hypothetical protein